MPEVQPELKEWGIFRSSLGMCLVLYICVAFLSSRNMSGLYSALYGHFIPRFPTFLVNLLFAPTSSIAIGNCKVKQLLLIIFGKCLGDWYFMFHLLSFEWGQINSLNWAFPGSVQTGQIVTTLLGFLRSSTPCLAPLVTVGLRFWITVFTKLMPFEATA